MTTLRQWAALAAVAAVGVLAAGWFLLVQPQRTAAADLRAQATEQERANGQTRTQLAVLAAQARDLPRQQQVLADVAEKIPATTAQPELVRALQGAADAAGVQLTSITPSAVTAVAGAASGGAVGTLQAMPVVVVVKGGYYQLEQYLTALEALPRAVRVTDLAIASTADEASGGADDGRSLTTTITGTAYVAAGAAPLSPAAASAAPVANEESPR